MATTTENLGLTLPAGTDKAEISVLNDNFQALDDFAGQATSDIQQAQETANAAAPQATTYTKPEIDAALATKQNTLTTVQRAAVDSGITAAKVTQYDNAADLAFKCVCPNNALIPDSTGNQSAMVYIPKFKNSDVLTGGNDSTHPAFIVNGQEIDGFWVSKYQNVVDSGKAYSLPCKDPRATITFESAIPACTSKGTGWHLMTVAEWAAIALWCKKNGFLPYGNNNYGKDSRESNYRAIRTTTNAGRTAHVATGTGPLSWSHDKTPSGIWDMNGNVSEWQGGIRLVWGELQILANNDAADPDNPQNATSTCWKAINASTGALVNPECSTTDATGTTSGNTVRLDYVSSKWKFVTSITSASDSSRNCAFGAVTCDSTIGDAAKVLLRALALLPDSGAAEADYEGDYFYWNNGAAERCVYRGGDFASGAYAGVFFVYGSDPRSYSATRVGFRSAYIPEIG